MQDAARYVQTLPGVVIGSNDFRNDIIVRGGSPLENLFIVDNMTCFVRIDKAVTVPYSTY